MRLVRRLAARSPEIVGHPAALVTAVALTLAWLAWGAVAGFSDTWLLVPAAVASVVTFLIVFSLQYSQNRDTRAIQLELDEILRASERARSELVKLERLSDEECPRSRTRSSSCEGASDARRPRPPERASSRTC